jgi:pilus assembly protein Flp/PilA
MRGLWSRLVADGRGATAVEYGLLAALIALVLVGALAAYSDAANLSFDLLGDTVRQR